jgi:hypothetical protein
LFGTAVAFDEAKIIDYLTTKMNRTEQIATNGRRRIDAVTGGSPFAVYDIEVLLNRGDGTFTAVETPLDSVIEPQPLVVADFNGDGHLDLIASDSTVLLGNGDGTFRTIPSSNGVFGSLPACLHHRVVVPSQRILD